MAAKRIMLQNADGSHCRWIGDRELADLLGKGNISKITGKKDAIQAYRFKSLPDASESKSTACQLTVSDEKALVGIYRVNDVWVERLIGFGLLPVNTPVPASGYLA